MRRLVRRIALAVPVAAAGLALGLTVPSGGSPGSASALPRPERDLAQAQRLAAFEIRLPSWLPDGAVLERVSWPPSPDGRAHAVDVWYRLRDGKRLHVWQTAAQSPEKNPAGRGTPVAAGGRRWWLERADLGTALTTRLADGVTMQIAGTIPDGVLQRIAGSFGGE